MPLLLLLLSWCLMSSDVIWHIRDKLWPMPKHGSIRKVYACLAVTCHMHFWQNDRDFLRATVVTRGWNGYRNKSQHRKATLEKKILPPFQQGFEPATFQSRVRCSNHWAIPAPYGVRYCWRRIADVPSVENLSGVGQDIATHAPPSQSFLACPNFYLPGPFTVGVCFVVVVLLLFVLFYFVPLLLLVWFCFGGFSSKSSPSFFF